MASFTLWPAIDIREGSCVRRYAGGFANEIIYGDPIEQARRYVASGATNLHIVDLDAALLG
jgi:phosphoribosylformimino-5-aminoimidazole carboxamide ribotide isomerase